MFDEEWIPDPGNEAKFRTPGRHDLFWTTPSGGRIQAWVR